MIFGFETCSLVEGDSLLPVMNEDAFAVGFCAGLSFASCFVCELYAFFIIIDFIVAHRLKKLAVPNQEVSE